MQEKKFGPRGSFSEQDVEELQRRAEAMLGRDVTVEEVKYMWDMGLT